MSCYDVKVASAVATLSIRECRLPAFATSLAIYLAVTCWRRNDPDNSIPHALMCHDRSRSADANLALRLALDTHKKRHHAQYSPLRRRHNMLATRLFRQPGVVDSDALLLDLNFPIEIGGPARSL